MKKILGEATNYEIFSATMVNVSIDLRLFQGPLKHLQARRTERNYKWALQAYEKYWSLWLPD